MVKKPVLTDSPDQLSIEEKTRVKAWCQGRFPRKVRHLGDLWESCRDWHLGKGHQRANWEAVFRNWIRTDDRFAKEKQDKNYNPYANETPQQPRPKGKADLIPILDIITGGKKE